MQLIVALEGDDVIVDLVEAALQHHIATTDDLLGDSSASSSSVQRLSEAQPHTPSTASQSLLVTLGGSASGSSALALLAAVADLESSVQAPPELLLLLQQHHSLAPAGPTLQHAGVDGTRAPQEEAAAAPSGPSGSGAAPLTAQLPSPAPPPLLPLLKRCGILTAIVPVHDPEAVAQLKSQVASSWLAPVQPFRHYFGNQVGYYLAFVNAVCCWLMAPSIVSAYLLAAARTDAALQGVSSPLVPVLVVFTLLWAAAGIQLWKQQQAELAQAWHAAYAAAAAAASAVVRVPGAGVTRHLATSASAVAVSAGDSTQPRITNAAGKAAAAMAATPSGRARVLPLPALLTPLASGVRQRCRGRWQYDLITRQWQLQEAAWLRWLRLAASASATGALLLLAAAVLLSALNLQGLISPAHSWLYSRRVAALGASSGGLLSHGMWLSQVPMVVRVVATALFEACIFGPAAKALTAAENHTTQEGFQSSLAAKQAALALVLTFVPPAYVGLAGAGAAAAAADVSGYFRLELLRRAAMEFALPWVTLRLAAHRGCAGAASSELQHQQQQQAALDAVKPAYDVNAGISDITRDLGYIVMFAAIVPWAAPVTLLCTLAKIKQDCMKLLLVVQRPLPLRGLSLDGSLTTVLTVQAFAAVLTNEFLSGLSSGQLALLLPSWLVPPAVAASLEAAASARPSDSSAAGSMGAPGRQQWPPSPLGTLRALDQHSEAAAALATCAPAAGPFGKKLALPGACAICHIVLPAAAASSDAGSATASHLLLLFALEHVLVLLMVLVMRAIPGQRPLTQRPDVAEGRRGITVQQDSQAATVSAAAPLAPRGVPLQPVKVHLNPLFAVSTARQHEGGSA